MPFEFWLALNEEMAVLTVAIAFPGFLPPKDGMEWFILIMLLIPMSLVWPLYFVLAPPIFLVMWIFGAWSPRDHFREWPWKYFFGTG